ncbi:MAG: tyrosine phosphatase family protein [Alphaproteobacteria bacterium]
MSAILVTPYSAVVEVIRRHRPSHMVTLLDPQTYVETPAGIQAANHLRLGVDDIVEPAEGSVCPSCDHIEEILLFNKNWSRAAPLLVHCWAGISRSTAAALIMLCDIHGPGHELDIAKSLRARAPHAHPNRLMIRHADAIMGREGRLIAAVEAMGAPRIVWEGEIVELPVRLEEL